MYYFEGKSVLFEKLYISYRILIALSILNTAYIQTIPSFKLSPIKHFFPTG